MQLRANMSVQYRNIAHCIVTLLMIAFLADNDAANINAGNEAMFNTIVSNLSDRNYTTERACFKNHKEGEVCAELLAAGQNVVKRPSRDTLHNRRALVEPIRWLQSRSLHSDDHHTTSTLPDP